MNQDNLKGLQSVQAAVIVYAGTCKSPERIEWEDQQKFIDCLEFPDSVFSDDHDQDFLRCLHNTAKLGFDHVLGAGQTEHLDELFPWQETQDFAKEFLCMVKRKNEWNAETKIILKNISLSPSVDIASICFF